MAYGMAPFLVTFCYIHGSSPIARHFKRNFHTVVQQLTTFQLTHSGSIMQSFCDS